MTGLSGWLGALNGADTPDNIATQMGDCLSRGAYDRQFRDNLKTKATRDGGLGLISRYPVNTIVEEDDFIATICGKVVWQNAALRSLAAEKGDEAALIEGYKRYETKVLQEMQGAWSAALISPKRKVALVAIDRMGVYPLCYGLGKGREFVFSSVTGGMRAFPNFAASVSPQAIYNYLYFFVAPAPTTIFDEIMKLEAAQFAYFKDGELSTGYYWEMPYTTETAGDIEDWSARLINQLDRSMLNTIEGVNPDTLGAFLSGGLDSSTVAGLMMKHNGKGKTFTIGFDDPKYDESEFAQIAARHFSTDHNEYFVVPEDVTAVQEKIAEIYDEPYGNTSAVPAYYCAKMAKENGIEVLLAGDGGDELFAGNERYVSMQKVEKYGLIPRGFRKGVMEPILSLPGVRHMPVLSKAHSLSKRYAIPMPDRLYSYGFFYDQTADGVFTSDAAAQVNPDLPLEILRKKYYHYGDSQMVQRMMHLDLQITLADNDLRKVNRMCDLAGVEVRYPFLDSELVDFAAGVPTDVLLKGGELRSFFKYALRDFLPQEVLTKEKHGFGLPFMSWVYQDKGINEQVCDNLTDFKKRGFLMPSFIDEVIAACHTDEPSGAGGFSWDVAMLELWFKKHL
ncbi:asparagine synthetase B family protein [Paremcibacter congregatus]|uniref:asparagine synthetase B family protein n=1 Tax=Paremcibacter congregatus TaxID=2043170 RepID=UPI0030EDA39E|tara:strand:+ start:6646 stop:8508 length:1863 start_codon:yes stop_codon:yes gene_type:complete